MVYQLLILQFPKAFVLVFIQPSFLKKSIFSWNVLQSQFDTTSLFNSTSSDYDLF